jgi:uncharacterized protein (TIGR02271 family)
MPAARAPFFTWHKKFSSRPLDADVSALPELKSMEERMKLEMRFYRTPDRKDTDRRTDENRDPITGARGAHPVGTGVGAAAGGAATGAAVGTVAGPVGTAAGIVGGAIVGGLAGKGVAEKVNPTAEREYWYKNYSREPYYRTGRTFDDYEGAYRTGYEGYSRYAHERNWDQCEVDLRKEYERNKGKSQLSWDEARPAIRAAWDRVDRNFERYIGHHVVDRDDEVIGKLSTLWTDETGEPAYLGVKTSWFSGKHHVIPAHSARVDRQRERIWVPFSEQAVKDAPAFDPDCELSDANEREIDEYYGRHGHQRRAQMQSQTGTQANLGTQQRTGRETNEATVKLSEEQLKVGKREVEAGGIRLRKIIRTETVNQPVTLKREEVIVERVPASEARATGERCFEQEEIYVPLRREEAVIQKEARVREEVRVRKEAQQDQQTITENVRREDVEIERQGEARETTRR